MHQLLVGATKCGHGIWCICLLYIQLLLHAVCGDNLSITLDETAFEGLLEHGELQRDSPLHSCPRLFKGYHEQPILQQIRVVHAYVSEAQKARLHL